MFKVTRTRNLYQSFRDGLLEDCVRFERAKVNLFDLIPKHSTGRLHTLAVMRKMGSQMAKEFPGGIKHDKGKLSFTPDFLMFAETHLGMDSTAEEAAKAWLALRGIA